MIESFPMIPASAKALWFLAGVGLLLTAVLAALVFVGVSSHSTRFDVSPDGLRIVGDFWGRTLAVESLDVGAARSVDLELESGLRPRRRTWGTGLPGYASGWFTLANGSRALVYLTDTRHVVYVPTRDGYSLLLSVADSAGFLTSLRQLRATGS